MNLETYERTKAGKTLRENDVKEEDLKAICAKIVEAVEKTLNIKTGLEFVQIGKSMIFFKDE